MLTVCSFYVDRRENYPDAVDYIPLLKALDRSCKRLDIHHVVLSDRATSTPLQEPGRHCYFDLPRDLTRATTEAQAQWLEYHTMLSTTGHVRTQCPDTLFVGADCLIVKEFRHALPEADLSIIFRPNDKLHRINNGFMYVPKASCAKVAKLFRKIADDTKPVMCDDMAAIERALAPMPNDYGIHERAGLRVNFLPIDVWNAGPKSIDDYNDKTFVAHFRGNARKKVMVDWAARWLAEPARKLGA
jgi:hypothetical protein